MVVVGHRYGSIVPELGISYSEAEYDEGRRLRKPCLVYIRDDNVPILPRLMETDPEKLRLLNRWKDALRSQHTVALFAQGNDLAVQVTADLSRALGDLAEAQEQEVHEEIAQHSISEEVTKLVADAIGRGISESAVLSLVRRSLASAIAASTGAGPTVFLSYSSADKELVRTFARGLEERGVSVWFDEMQLRPGQEWGREIERALDSSDYIAFFVSKNSMRRGFVQKELSLAFERSRTLPVERAFLIPVLLDRAAVPDMPPLLRDIQWLDATDGDIPSAIERLARAIAVHREK